MNLLKLKISIRILITGSFAIAGIISSAQSLPEQYYFSTDGKRLIRGISESTGFYDTQKIDTVFLTFDQPNYWSLLLANYSSKTDIPAKMKYKNVVYSGVGVRFKGETSYRTVPGDKKSFNISLDFTNEDQKVEGYNTLNLNNSAEDHSRMREFLYEYFSRRHIPSAKTNYVVLFINNQNWGIYINVQQLNKSHAREWFPDADATRWRAEPVNRTVGTPGTPGGGFGAGTSSINYLNTNDTTIYQKYYTIKNSYKKNPWDDLVKACYTLNKTPQIAMIDSLGKYLDIDGSLWFLAHEILFTDEDGYINKGGTDYYVYFDVHSGRILPIEYDGNSCFINSKATTWTPFEKEFNTSYPLSNILLRNPELRQRYLAHVRTILDQTFRPAYYDSVINKYSKQIDRYITDDPKKLYSYSQFVAAYPLLKSFMNTRRNYMLSNSEVNENAPIISNVVFKASNDDFSIPDNSQAVNVSAKVQATPGISKVFLYYGTSIAGRFTKVEMFDDGKNDDGIADNSVYGIKIPAFPSGTFVRYYIEAVSSNTAGSRTYSPRGAEHDVYFYQVKYANTVRNDVVINEFMASNTNYITDQSGDYDDWIELFNNSSEAVNLSGYYLTDNINKLTKWKFPNGTVIAGKGYLIIWADEQTSQPGLHANFKLSAEGESILLVTPELKIADEITFGAMASNVSMARNPNGTGSFMLKSPTFNISNSLVTKIEQIIESDNSFSLYPNPASAKLNLELDSENTELIEIYNSAGLKVFEKVISGRETIDLSNLKSGLYFVKCKNKTRKLVLTNR